MGEIINVQHLDGQLLVSSREISTNFEKEHGKVIRAVEEHIEKLIEVGNPKVACEMFTESTYENRGKFYKEYLINRDGFSLLVMSFNNTKDVLNWKLKYINAFNKMEQQIKNPYSNMSKELQAIFTIDKKQQEIEVKVDKLYNTMTIDYAQQEDLRMTANIRVCEILGGKKTEAYKKLKNRVFQDLWRSYKRHFRVNSYKNTATKDYEDALNYIENYEVDEVIQYAIEGLNRQLVFA